MGQSQITRGEGAVDLVITNALIIDYTGIYKADIGVKDGKIHSIGKAGNPDIQDGISIIIGPATEIIAGENIDSWRHGCAYTFYVPNKSKMLCTLGLPQCWERVLVLHMELLQPHVHQVHGT